MRKKSYEYVGKRLPRMDADLQLTGACRYGDDYYLPGMLIAKPKYSDISHGKILNINVSEAESMPGVAAIITHKDIPCNRYGNATPPDQYVLSSDRVLYHGDCIAVVAAETRQQAEDAAKRIHVTYEELPAIKSIEEALAPDAPPARSDYPDNLCATVDMNTGDVEAAMRQADMVIEQTYETQKVDHTPIEPRVALAIPSADGSLHIISSNSRVFNFVRPLTQILKMPMSQLRVSAPEGIGGSFGGKNDLLIEPWVAVLALKTRRSVKMTLTREDDMSTSTVRHAYKITHRTGVMKDGTIVADAVTMYSDTGAYFALGPAQLHKAAVHCCGAYTVPNLAVKAYLVFTNTLNGSAMRGMGVPQSCFAWESHLNLIANRLDMDPVELRRKNLFHDSGVLANGQVVDSEAARLCMEKALTLFKNSPQVPLSPHKKRGVGIANMIYPHDSCGPSGATSVFLKVDSDGSVVIYNGLSDVGQGSKTALSQLAAEILSIPIEKINFVASDTLLTPFDEGTPTTPAAPPVPPPYF